MTPGKVAAIVLAAGQEGPHAFDREMDFVRNFLGAGLASVLPDEDRVVGIDRVTERRIQPGRQCCFGLLAVKEQR